MQHFLIPLFALTAGCWLWGIPPANAQEILKYRATNYTICTKLDGEWTNWSDWEGAGLMLVVFDTNKRKITLYLKQALVFDIYQYDEWEKPDEDCEVLTCHAVDDDGDQCLLHFVKFTEGDLQLHIVHEAFAVVYQIE